MLDMNADPFLISGKTEMGYIFCQEIHFWNNKCTNLKQVDKLCKERPLFLLSYLFHQVLVLP